MSEIQEKSVAILGSRGLPASHGGFETFVENLVPVLVEHDWRVTVYCQEIGKGPITTSEYNGVELVHIKVEKDTPLHTVIFDCKSTLHACRNNKLLLTLGYNTGFLSIYCRLKKIYNIINMDGLEWKRGKWSMPVRIWFYLNERIACLMGNHLIADHPEIKKHLQTRVSPEKITMIPYGAIKVESPELERIEAYGINPNCYAIVIARIEPENLILEIVKAFSRKKRGCHLVILGNLYPESSRYHAKIKQAASSEVKFLGAVYDPDIVSALRYYARCYVHGHTVGGTNPSLVEALGAGCSIVAHDNPFNRWVTQGKMRYFNSVDSCCEHLDQLLTDDSENAVLKRASTHIFDNTFQWLPILNQYENLLDITSKNLAQQTLFAGKEPLIK